MWQVAGKLGGEDCIMAQFVDFVDGIISYMLGLCMLLSSRNCVCVEWGCGLLPYVLLGHVKEDMRELRVYTPAVLCERVCGLAMNAGP